jgi:hypothetical protein
VQAHHLFPHRRRHGLHKHWANNHQNCRPRLGHPAQERRFPHPEELAMPGT